MTAVVLTSGTKRAIGVVKVHKATDFILLFSLYGLQGCFVFASVKYFLDQVFMVLKAVLSKSIGFDLCLTLVALDFAHRTGFQMQLLLNHCVLLATTVAAADFKVAYNSFESHVEGKVACWLPANRALSPTLLVLQLGHAVSAKDHASAQVARAGVDRELHANYAVVFCLI